MQRLVVTLVLMSLRSQPTSTASVSHSKKTAVFEPCYTSEKVKVVDASQSTVLASTMVRKCFSSILLKYKFPLSVIYKLMDMSCVVSRILYTSVPAAHIKLTDTDKFQLIEKAQRMANLFITSVADMKFVADNHIDPKMLREYMNELSECSMRSISDAGFPRTDSVILKSIQWLKHNLIW